MAEWPLIGRERELREIAGARADPACHGAVVSAGPGVGKSRLARAALAEADGALVEWVQATRSAATVPLAAVATLVPPEARSDDVVQLMRGCAESLRERAAGRSVVIAVDDAQLLDPVSAAPVLHLSASSFIVATVRAGEAAPDAIDALRKDALRIELGDVDVRALVEAALGDPVEEAALAWVAEISRGNALYARELVEGAIESGTLAHTDGFWRLTRRPAAPMSLIELVDLRLAALEPGPRLAVELLALGEPLRPEELAALTSEDALLAAEERGLLELRGEVHPTGGAARRCSSGRSTTRYGHSAST